MRHGYENFKSESLVGVYRHFVGELHPTSVFRMKIQYVESSVVEVDVCYKALLKASKLLLLLLLLLRHDDMEYHGVCGGGADDRVER
jgi:hypothetical protein